jgi:hypothetical protein
MMGFWQTRETAKTGGIGGLGLARAKRKDQEKAMRERQEQAYLEEQRKGKRLGAKRIHG